MFCRNCGNPMDPSAVVCVRCGCPKGSGTTYCANCGQPVGNGMAVCMNCGCAIAPAVNPDAKSKLVAGLLGILLGSLGVHNFYLGYTGKGVAQLLISLLSCGTLSFVSAIWGLIEGILILADSAPNDANGNPLKN